MTDTPDRWGAAPFMLTSPTGTTATIIVKGRDRWALETLMRAGRAGCTPITHPGPRWSGYVFNLRKLGVIIETIHEQHIGPFKGNHARYVLRSTVAPVPGKAVA